MLPHASGILDNLHCPPSVMKHRFKRTSVSFVCHDASLYGTNLTLPRPLPRRAIPKAGKFFAPCFVSGLAEKLGMDPQQLETTFREPTNVRSRSAETETCVGLGTDNFVPVLNLDGEPVPNLAAVGNDRMTISEALSGRRLGEGSGREPGPDDTWPLFPAPTAVRQS